MKPIFVQTSVTSCHAHVTVSTTTISRISNLMSRTRIRWTPILSQDALADIFKGLPTQLLPSPLRQMRSHSPNLKKLQGKTVKNRNKNDEDGPKLASGRLHTHSLFIPGHSHTHEENEHASGDRRDPKRILPSLKGFGVL